MPIELSDNLKIAGLTHIVVASGYNLTIFSSFSATIFAKFIKNILDDERLLSDTSFYG